MKAVVFAAVTIFAGVVAAGCLDANESEVRVDRPRIGDSYEYSGSDGSALTVRVVGVETRHDGFGRAFDAAILNWTVQWPDDTRFYFEEAVDPLTGLIIQQVALCGTWIIDHSVSEQPSCWDDRSLVLFGASGFAGAFGGGPLWQGQRLDGDHLEIMTNSLATGLGTLRYQARAAPEEGCTRLEAEARPSSLSMLPWTVIGGPLVVCTEHPFPTHFRGALLPPPFSAASESGEAPTYVLTRWTRGDQVLPEVTNQAQWDSEGIMLPIVAWEKPLFVLGHQEPFAFTIDEAHEAALSVPEYARVAEAEPAAVLLESRFSAAGSSSSPPFNDSHEYDRRIQLVNHEGHVVDVLLRKTIVEHHAIPAIRNATVEERIRILSVSSSNLTHYPSPATASANQSRIGDAFERGAELTGQRYRTEPAIISFMPGGHAWVASAAELRLDGYEITLRYAQPGVDPNASFVRVVPFVATFDGPTGGVLALHRPHTAMPY